MDTELNRLWKLAISVGFRVHHDIHGWFVVAPDEDEPEDGYSLGFDGRAHWISEAMAWEEAGKLAETDA